LQLNSLRNLARACSERTEEKIVDQFLGPATIQVGTEFKFNFGPMRQIRADFIGRAEGINQK